MIETAMSSCCFATPACASASAPTYLRLSPPVGPQSWAIHVPLGKLKTERLVPVDAFVCRLVERLRLLRSQDPTRSRAFSWPARVAATRSSAACAVSGGKSSPRSGSRPGLSRTNCDIPSAQR